MSYIFGSIRTDSYNRFNMVLRFSVEYIFSIFCPVCLGKKVTQGFDHHLTHNSFEAEIAEQEPVKVKLNQINPFSV